MAKDELVEGGQRRGWRDRLGLRRRRVEAMRVVSFPHAAHSLLHPHGGQPNYRGNRTSTTKYTLLSFLPKALFEQYRCGAGLARARTTPLCGASPTELVAQAQAAAAQHSNPSAHAAAALPAGCRRRRRHTGCRLCQCAC